MGSRIWPVTWVLLLSSGIVWAEDPNGPDVRWRPAREAWDEYQKSIAESAERARREEAAALEKYRGALAAALDIVLERKDLDEANRIKRELDRVKGGNGVGSSAGQPTPGPPDLREFAGTYQGKWYTTGRAVTLCIDPDGTCAIGTERRPPSYVNGRLLYPNRKNPKGEHFEAVFRGKKLLLLGWGVQLDLDPMTDGFNHVGSLKRTD